VTGLDTSLGAMLDPMLDTGRYVIFDVMSMLDAILGTVLNTELGVWVFRAARLDIKLSSMLTLIMHI